MSSSERVVAERLVAGGGFSTCPQCLAQFRFRKSKTYCRPKCRIYASRPVQNSQNSPTKRRQNLILFDTARLMGERLYSLPPQERLGHMKALIDEARAGNTALREILSNWKLIHPNPQTERWLFPRGSPSYCTIAQAAQNYCKKFWRANVADVVYCRVPEPPTGEV